MKRNHLAVKNFRAKISFHKMMCNSAKSRSFAINFSFSASWNDWLSLCVKTLLNYCETQARSRCLETNIGVRVKNDPFQPCSSAGGAKCPSSHPYVYYNGEYCCASNREKYDESHGTKCDRSEITRESLCCEGDRFVKCPSGNCQSKDGKLTKSEEFFKHR